jgi:hypothetical protein
MERRIDHQQRQKSRRQKDDARRGFLLEEFFDGGDRHASLLHNQKTSVTLAQARVHRLHEALAQLWVVRAGDGSSLSRG